MSFVATATATDPFSLTDEDTSTIPTGGSSGITHQRRTFYENRVNFGNPVEVPPLGPNLDTPDQFLVQRPNGPVTLGHTYTVSIDCEITGVRIFKGPTATGAIEVGMWDDAGVELAADTDTWVSDKGGWREYSWAPVALQAGDTFDVGYFYPTADDNYVANQYVWNGGLDMYVHPFTMHKFDSGGGTKVGGSWNHTGGGAKTWSNAANDRWPADYYIDPIAEWDTDLPIYVSGRSYWDQFVNGPKSPDVPIMVWWPNANRIADYLPLGINRIIGDYGSNDDYIAAIKAAAVEWWPFLHEDDMNAPIAVLEDDVLAAFVTGYFITDEPDVVRPYYSPDVVKTWRNHCRELDSTRPMWLNLSRYAFENQGFTWQPAGITAKNANLQWRDYVALSDVATVDAYSINATYPYNVNTTEENRYGIWTYPLQVDWARKMADLRCPVFGVVETSSTIPNKPTPTEVKKATWALLIAGATGIEFFQHRFADADVTQDFASMVDDSAMITGITALTTQIQAVKDAIFAPEANLASSVVSSNEGGTSPGPVGGLYGTPIHYTTRQAGGLNYLFAQSIRPGGTTGTFTVPSAAGKTISVLDEGRTLIANGSGVFTDAFASDYAYHLYRWTP
jgi:hypothetical protein